MSQEGKTSNIIFGDKVIIDHSDWRCSAIPFCFHITVFLQQCMEGYEL